MHKTFSIYSLKKRILAILLVISFIFCSLIIRLFIIQVIDGKKLQQRATDQWTRDLSIVAPRGNIYDTKGSTLAVSYTSYNVFSRAREIANISLTAKTVAEILGLDFKYVYNKINNKKISENLIKLKVDKDIAQKLYDAKLKGIYMVENSSRYYPYGNFLSQLIGFTSVDNVGQSGVEAYYNSDLKGKNGASFVQSDLQGKEIGESIRYYLPAIKGNDIYLTIDANFQHILEENLDKIMLEQKAKNTTGIIIDVKNNDILAISTKPSMNLNDLPRNNLNQLFECSKVKAVTDVYEPGSTFKILTLAAALEENLTNLNDRFYCPGYRIVDGVRIKCWRSIGHGSQTLKEAFANSCNCCFMDLALRLGKEKFYKYMSLFGLGQKTGINISGETNGILMNKNLVKKVDLARMGFGHAIALTPIQLVSAVDCVVNNGRYLAPNILKNIVKKDDNIIKNTEKIKKNAIISEKTSKIVNLLLEFAENKKGDYTFVEGYNVGGKTGTAQKYKKTGGIDRGKYISSFIGTYPANQPKYLLFIMVDEPGAGAYYGSVVAAPYGKKIFSQLFDLLDEEKQDKSIILEKVKMPFLEGKSLVDAIEVLNKIGLYYEIDGEGEYITKQLPPVDTELYKGSTILLKT